MGEVHAIGAPCPFCREEKPLPAALPPPGPSPLEWVEALTKALVHERDSARGTLARVEFVLEEEREAKRTTEL